MQTVKVSNGVEMPILGLGVYQVPDAATCERVIGEALEIGYRSIDTAAAYLNEEAVGAAIAKSGIPRGDLFVTSKLWVQDMGYDAALGAFDRTMKRLGLDVLDLYLIHQPFGDVYGAWRALERLLAEGRVRAIGVCNFMPDRLMDLCVHCAVRPALNQIETHPFYARFEDNKLMAELGVAHESWAPFAEGHNDIFNNPTLSAIGAAHGKSAAQVILRWLTQRGIVVIPKSVRKERLLQNFESQDFDLTPAEMEAIAALDTGKSVLFSHRDPAIVRWISEMKLDI